MARRETHWLTCSRNVEGPAEALAVSLSKWRRERAPRSESTYVQLVDMITKIGVHNSVMVHSKTRPAGGEPLPNQQSKNLNSSVDSARFLAFTRKRDVK